MTPSQRYQHDPVFHHMVDVLQAAIEGKLVTARDALDAAVLAGRIVDERRSRDWLPLPSPAAPVEQRILNDWNVSSSSSSWKAHGGRVDLVFRTLDHPEAGGARPKPDEKFFRLFVMLEDGRRLDLEFGKATRRELEVFLLGLALSGE